MRNFINISLVFLFAALPSFAADTSPPQKLAHINHIIIFYLENHSFDSLFGNFPGADGFAQAQGKTMQTDMDGKPYAFLPRVLRNGKPDLRFPEKLPNAPFLITQYVSESENTGDMVHRFYQLQEQMDGGKMDHFVAAGDSGGLTMGYYGDRNSLFWQYAKKYTLQDHFFTAAYGGSFLNHMWLICACTPFYADAPASIRAQLDKDGRLVKDGAVTPDGYAVNTIQPVGRPYNDKAKDPVLRLPMQDMDTIGERLNERHVSWAWYSGGWNDAEADKADKSFVHMHQPFVYFRKYAVGTASRKEHLKDKTDFIRGIEKGELPAVSFYKPIGEFDLHPDYSNLKSSEEYVFRMIRMIEGSLLWKDSIIIVTFDDAGGFYDHVPPPRGDRFGPGERVPTLIISPFAKHGFVDHTVYNTTSILKLIEMRFGLKPLAERDAKADGMLNSLQ